MTLQNPAPDSPDTIALRDWSLAELFHVALKGWKWIAASVAVCVVLAMAVIRFSTPIYTISMVVGPRTEGLTHNTDLGIAGRLLGAAASQQGANFELYTQLLISNAVARRLVDEHHFERRIWAANWNEQTQTWTAPSGVMPALSGAGKALLGWPQWRPPGSQDVADYLGRMIQINSTKSGIFSVSSIYRVQVRLADAKLAVELLTLLHTEADTILRTQRMKELEAAIAYLELKLRETTIVAAQNALADALAAATRERVLLLGDSSYAAILVDPPAIPKRPSSPQPVLLLAGAVVFGGGLGFGIALMRRRRGARNAH